MTPYENRLQLDGFHRIGLIAKIHPDQQNVFAETAAGHEISASANITHLNLFARQVDESVFAFAFFHYKGSNPERAIAQFLEDYPWQSSLEKRFLLSQEWKRMELINSIALAPISQDSSPQVHGVMSNLNLKDESAYRMLHQSNWAGVVDQMIRSNYRNWTTFLFEHNGDLLLFTHFEYIGNDRAADDAAMAADPTTQRWWKLTVPCLNPVEKNADLWSPMKLIAREK